MTGFHSTFLLPCSRRGRTTGAVEDPRRVAIRASRQVGIPNFVYTILPFLGIDQPVGLLYTPQRCGVWRVGIHTLEELVSFRTCISFLRCKLMTFGTKSDRKKMGVQQVSLNFVFLPIESDFRGYYSKLGNGLMGGDK